MRILGIDPGMAIVGYCVLDVSFVNGDYQYDIVDTGSIQTKSSLDNASRLLEIHNDLCWIINEYKPDVASVEQIFFFKNAKTVMPVCEARGVIVMTLKMQGVQIYEYTPLVIKQTITGYGRADKNDVKDMVKIILNKETLPKLDDTTDAIAIAICHSRNCEFITV